MSGSVAFHNDTETSAWGSGSVYYNEDGTFWTDFKDDLPTLFSAPVDVDGTLTSSEVSFVQSGLVAVAVSVATLSCSTTRIRNML